MGDTQKQKMLFDFLKEKFESGEAFTKADVIAATGWEKKGTFNTYWSKQLQSLTVPAETANHFYVGELFRRYGEWKRFKAYIVTQKRRVMGNYESVAYDNLIIFEFFMPLSNEESLRSSLDALFYSETILRRLKQMPRNELEQRFPNSKGLPDEKYFESILTWISDHFGGYSILHVSGRFKVSNTLSVSDAGKSMLQGERYLVDETTAIVRFIFPIGKGKMNPPSTTAAPLGSLIEADGTKSAEDEQEASLVRWMFGVLFVTTILQVVSGEDEVWMIESGMRTRLHRWKGPDENEEAETESEEQNAETAED